MEVERCGVDRLVFSFLGVGGGVRLGVLEDVWLAETGLEGFRALKWGEAVDHSLCCVFAFRDHLVEAAFLSKALCLAAFYGGVYTRRCTRCPIVHLLTPTR